MLNKSTLHAALAGLMLITSLGIGVPAYAAKTTALSAEETADLLFMREEEKMARDTYLTLFEVWGINTFSSIAVSEQKHMDSMLKLIEKYKLTDPAAGNVVGEFTNPALQALYDTLVAMGREDSLSALMVGGLIEETDMRDIKDAIEDSQKADIDKVYANLMCGSRNHLRSFAAAIEAATGEDYEAQVLSEEEVDAILDSPMERCK